MESPCIDITISVDNITKKFIKLYKILGLEVIHERNIFKIFSTKHAQITKIDGGIHVTSTKVTQQKLIDNDIIASPTPLMPIIIMDEINNKIILTIKIKKKKNRIAILTSGGDASGMNPAIKSIVKTGYEGGDIVYGVYKGYSGLIKDKIKKIDPDFETHISSKGGTVLYSARSKRFMTLEGRKEGAFNLIKRGINSLIVIGGDGSLTGANQIQNEFKDHFTKLIAEKRIKEIHIQKIFGKNSEEFKNFNEDDMIKNPEKYIYDLKVVGIPASIDNDVYGTDYCLGVDSALTRVSESTNSLLTTLKSHDLVFVVEVMGRNCGWLAILSAMANAVDYVLLPEVPVDWKVDMINTIKIKKRLKKAGVMIIISEGAINKEGETIRATHVINEITKNGFETRFIKLGHIQRGGAPSAIDRLQGAVFGLKSVEMLTTSKKLPAMIGIKNNKYIEIALPEVIKNSKKIKKLEKKLDFEKVKAYRGDSFNISYKYFEDTLLYNISNKKYFPVLQDILENSIKPNRVFDQNRNAQNENDKHPIWILHAGSLASGINATMNAVTQYAIINGHDVNYILNGFKGLIAGDYKTASLFEFSDAVKEGGSAIGLGETKNVDINKVVKKIKEYNIKNLIIIGDINALFIAKEIKGINLSFIPSSISCNIPATDVSIGSDTSLNAILKVSDYSKLASISMKKTVFIIELDGGNCGYLAYIGGIAAGAFETFLPERKYMISHLSETAHRLRSRFKKNPNSGVILFRSKNTFCSMSTEDFCKALETESRDTFVTDYAILGHLQYGGNPSPADKINGLKMGVSAVKACVDNKGQVLIGIVGNMPVITDIDEAVKKFDKEKMICKKSFWTKCNYYCKPML